MLIRAGLVALLAVVTASASAAPQPRSHLLVGDRGDVFVLPLRGLAGQRPLLVARTGDRALMDAAWAPDAARIVFTTYNESFNAPQSIVFVGRAGSRARELRRTSLVVGEVYWRSGRELVFVACSPTGALNSCRASTLDVVTRVRKTIRDGLPTPLGLDVTPDGARIAFATFTDGDEDVFLADGGFRDIRRLTFARGRDRFPGISPDGETIVFSSERDRYGGCADREDRCLGWFEELYAIGADGTGVRRLTRSVASDFGPAWSPDGALIAWTVDDRLWLMNADGTCKRRVAALRGEVFGWSPDSRPGRMDC